MFTGDFFFLFETSLIGSFDRLDRYFLDMLSVVSVGNINQMNIPTTVDQVLDGYVV